MMISRVTLLASVAALGLSVAAPAWAQGAQEPRGGDPQEQLESDDGRDNVIVVTATKRAESLQDVGQTIAAFSGENVRDLGVSDTMDVINLVPGTGIFEPDGGGIPVIIIRGVGLQNFRINDTPTTAIYADEVYQTSVAEAVGTIFDVERVEVLKGPQGGLYGRNAVGGAIQIISAKPDFGGFEGFVSASYEEYGRFEGELVLNTPISDTLAFRAAGKIIQGGGYFRNVIGDFDYGDADRLAGRALLAWQPASNIDVLLKVQAGKDGSELPLARSRGIYAPLGLGLGIPDTADGAVLNSQADSSSLSNICAPALAGSQGSSICETLNGKTQDELGIRGRYDSAIGSRPELDNDYWSTSLKVDADFGALTFSSITAYSRFNYRRYIDQDGLPEIHQEIDYNSDLEAWSQELRLAFDDGGPVNGLIGVSYAEDTIDEDTLLLTETGLLRSTLGGLTRASQLYVQSTEAFAVFGRADWRLTDQFEVVLEARFTEEEKGLDGGTYLPQVGVTLAEIDESTTYNAISGKIALEYSPTSDVMLYASYSEGFKSGGYFGGFATNPAQLEPFDQEEISAIEVGFKTEFPDHGLRLNGAGFYYDRRDVQASGIDTSGIVPISRLTNVGDVEVYGAEVEFVWNPIQQFTLQAGASYIKNEIVSSDTRPGNLFNLPREATFVGARLPNQPEWSGNVVALFEEDLNSSLTGSVQLSYTYRGEQDLGLVVFPEERMLLTEDAYHLFDLKFSIESIENQWKFSVYAENLLDEEYRTNAAASPPAGFLEIYGAPQIFGASIEKAF